MRQGKYATPAAESIAAVAYITDTDASNIRGYVVLALLGDDAYAISTNVDCAAHTAYVLADILAEMTRDLAAELPHISPA